MNKSLHLDIILRDCSIVLSVVMDRSALQQQSVYYRYRMNGLDVFNIPFTNPNVFSWELTSKGFWDLDMPVDLDELALCLHNEDFTPDPFSEPVHLSQFLPELPDMQPMDKPYRIFACTYFIKYSSASPLMSKSMSGRVIEGSPRSAKGQKECFRLGNSDLYMVQTISTDISLIHALLTGISSTYRGMNYEDKMFAINLYIRMTESNHKINPREYFGIIIIRQRWHSESKNSKRTRRMHLQNGGQGEDKFHHYQYEKSTCFRQGKAVCLHAQNDKFVCVHIGREAAGWLLDSQYANQ